MRGLQAAAIATLIVLTVSCGGKSTGPSPLTSTDTFTGSVAQGATSFGDGNRNHFTVRQPGLITATITRLAPTSTITIGLGLGVFNTATSTCSLQNSADAAKLNLSLNSDAATAGEFCVGVYDVGDIHETPIEYTVTVVHP
jgi:hypothetical protein